MRTKKIYSFDEEIDAKKIIQRIDEEENNSEEKVIDYAEMYLVAKYLRDKHGYGTINLERELIKYCKKINKDFNPIVENRALKRWISSALRYGLRKIDSVPISEKEIEFLNSIKTNKDRKLLFATLVLAKAIKVGNTRRDKKEYKSSNKHYIKYHNFSDIIGLSGVPNVSEIKLANIFYKYKDHLTLYNPEKELIRLDFIEEYPQKEIMLTELQDIPKLYEELFGYIKPTGKCENCGIEIVLNSNSQKYCDECAIKVQKERRR